MKNQKRNIINFRTKAEVILIAMLFIGIAVSSVWGTVTMTDKTTTTDDSGLIINYEEGWINVWNATIDNSSVDATVINQWNLGYTWIGDQIFNASDAQALQSSWMALWNLSYAHLGDPFFNASDAQALQSSWMSYWNLSYAHLGDPFFNASDAQALTSAWMSYWNLSYAHLGDPFFNDSKASSIDNDMMLGWNASNNTLIRNSNGNSWSFDGTDDDVQIQAAIDDLTTGGTVWLPSGTFEISTDILLDSDIDLKGAGMDSTILKAKDSTTIGTGIIYCNGIHNFSISGMTLDGNHRGGANGNLIKTNYGCYNYSITDCKFFNMRGNAIQSYLSYYGIYSNLIMHDFHRTDAAHGFQGLSMGTIEDCTFDNIIITDGDESCQGFDFASSKNCEISNIKVKDFGIGAKFTSGSENITADNIRISGTTNASQWNFAIDGRGHSLSNLFVNGSGSFAVICLGDYIDISNVHIYGASAISLGLAGSHIDVTGGTIEHSASQPIRITGDNITVTGVQSVTSSSILIFGAEDVRLIGCSNMGSSASGLYLRDSVRVTISGSAFNYNTGDGILSDITGCSHFKIIGCDVMDNGEDGIDINEVCHNFSINGGIISGNGANGIDIDADVHDFYAIIGVVISGNSGANSINDDGTGDNRFSDANLAAYNILDKAVG